MSRSFFPPVPPVTKNLLIINVLAWLATKALYSLNIDLVYLGGLHFFTADGFNILQPFTYMFLHDPSGISHLLFNMFAVWMFGGLLERTWGSKRFIIYYLFTGVGAGLVQELVWFFSLQSMNPMEAQVISNYLVTIGASGAVFGILLAFGMLFPNMPLFIMFIPIPIKAKWVVIGYGVIELFLGIAGRSGDNVAHFAHLGGMLFGLILILWWRKKYGKERYY